MELVTAERDGWPKLRLLTFSRDKGCVAANPAIMGSLVASDQCRDRNGWLIPWNDLFRMEWDHVKQDGVRYNDIAHGVTVCPWHHRGSRWRSDSKVNREAIRAYLLLLYPAVWSR